MAGRRLTTPGAATTWLPTARPVGRPATRRRARGVPHRPSAPHPRRRARGRARVRRVRGHRGGAARESAAAHRDSAARAAARRTTECTPVNNDGYQVCSRDKGSLQLLEAPGGESFYELSLTYFLDLKRN